MATVYLKGGKSVQVSIEDLERYLEENCDRIEIRKKELRRPPIDINVTSASSK